MDPVLTKTLILLAVLAAVMQLVDGDCVLDDYEQRPCEGKLLCSDNFDVGINEITDWPCRNSHNDYNSDYGQESDSEDDFIIHIEAINIDETHLLEPFNLIDQLSGHIHTLSVTDGKMNSIPAPIFGLWNVKKIDLSKNTIEVINLQTFNRLGSLRLLNVSCNRIADLEDYYTRPTTSEYNVVNTIDLSHNAITTIPDNYFRQFSGLLHLNLSHNYIKSFDILTFEGITQLQTLYISDNELTTLGVFFARFAFLQELFLDHNYLTIIEKNNFNTMTVLEKLNISWNSIIGFEDTAFDRLVALKELDLRSNKINNITKNIFQHNLNLLSLDLSLNKISQIEPGAFEGKRIRDFKIDNNPIDGSLPANTFQGIFMDRLDLSGANITELGPDLFETKFKSLNFSKNSISKIHKTTFNKLELLTDLDLSYNQLKNIEFETSNLKNLSHFSINNNYIKRITKDMFTYLTKLKILDLSNNVIDEVEMYCFEHLNQLKLLKLNNNPLSPIILSQWFSGLVSSSFLDLSATLINTIQKNAFNGMKSLKTFNSSNSNLSVLDENAFSGTGSIQILDLSYCQIETFSLNNTNIKLVEEIYLQYNKLQFVTNETFMGLADLRLLTLKGNKLIRIENNAFRNLQSLLKIDLSDNNELVFNSSVFSGMQTLSVILLNNVTSKFNLASIVNTSIAGLDLSFCNITAVSNVLVNPIMTLERLKMASNKILSINKSSFQKMHQLSWVDLSYNKISNIQPGSFSDNEDLSVLDLNNNLLSTLMFGVFDGLVNLNTLDVSNNKLQSFSASIFHNTPRVQVVFLDNNLIDNLDFDEFSKDNIREVYLGGNYIPCDSLTKLKKIPHTFVVTAKHKVYDTENVDGIACRSFAKHNELIKKHENETPSTAKSIASLDEFQTAVEKILNRSESYSISKFAEVLNKTESNNNVFLEKLINSNHQVTGSIYRILDNIQEYLKVHSSVPVSYNTPETEYMKSNSNVIEKAQYKKQMKYTSKIHETGAELTAEPTDLKYPLYFIATCLGVLLCMAMLSFAFVFFKSRNTGRLAYGNDLSHSRQPISNIMEME